VRAQDTGRGAQAASGGAQQAASGGAQIATESGPAVAELDGDAAAPRFLLVLTHGAGGGTGSPDLLAARDAAVALGGLVARVLQPYRVRGGRAPGSAAKQDAAWLEIVAALRQITPAVPLVQGGRSNGARVACRTAVAVGAQAVLALAFPLHPPGKPASSRVAELREPRAVGIPVLVINGERDPFGIPEPGDADRVVVVPRQTHALTGQAAVIRTAITEWLPARLPMVQRPLPADASPRPTLPPAMAASAMAVSPLRLRQRGPGRGRPDGRALGRSDGAVR
jgi:uncharacterized protein